MGEVKEQRRKKVWLKLKKDGDGFIYIDMPHASEIWRPLVFLCCICMNSRRRNHGLLCQESCQIDECELPGRENLLCSLQEAFVKYSASVSLEWLVLLFFLSQVCLHYFKPMPFCSTWRTGWPNRSFRRSSSSECLWPQASSSSQSFISRIQVCSDVHLGLCAVFFFFL